MASIHTPRFVNNLISTGCLWRGNSNQGAYCQLSNCSAFFSFHQTDSWAVWFQPCFSAFRASCSQGGSLRLEQVEGLLQRVNFSRSGALLWWKKPTAWITVWLHQWTRTSKTQEKQALQNMVIPLPRTLCWGHLLWHLQVHLAIHISEWTSKHHHPRTRMMPWE